jgi:hypothetical protein
MFADVAGFITCDDARAVALLDEPAVTPPGDPERRALTYPPGL